MYRKLHNEDLYIAYSSRDIIRIIKSRRMMMGVTCYIDEKDEKCLQNFSRKIRKEGSTEETCT